ncbi:hypothetical protein [Flavobacterium hydatis]|uniref:Alpha/beta hydrolase n=1 Tax=Flavobacterium hydatis TaxID=991 RepID=A0A085ZVS2_FLAHY|nr:hypothetical protein [Flavobacterium hydatis]KFF08536.1 hypothetical protein IW20_23650 [Flavobacterium hydatis]OXA91056.1 hypothetical protein B0A62_18435 [Flavobacterium hydatis]
MRKQLSMMILFGITFCYGQKMEKVTVDYLDTNDLYVNDDDSQVLFYYKMVPKTEIIGALVILPSGGESTEDLLKQITLHELAVKKGILVIIPSINWSTDSKEAEFSLLDKIFKEIVIKHKVSKDNFILGGLSNGGIISLTYAENAVKNPSKFFLIPKGIFALDAPLDETRFYKYCEREIKRNFSEAGVNEAKWMKDNWDSLYGGSPDQFPEKYIEASIFSFGAKDGGNAKYLKNMPIRMYTDLDVDWLINERHRDLYDWNGIDIVAMISQLKVLGNNNASVIISQGKGVKLNGTKNPHSWSIMDSENCLNWALNLFNK